MQLRLHKSSDQTAFTLIEVMIATTIAAVASAAMISIFIMSSHYVAEGYTESRILSNAAIAIETISRDITLGYNQGASTSANRPTVSNSNKTYTYTVPLAGGATQQRRFRYDSVARVLHHEVLNGATWQDRANKRFLREVDSFQIFMDNLEGSVSFFVTIRVTMATSPVAANNLVKRYTMVGRSVPRNM